MDNITYHPFFYKLFKRIRMVRSVRLRRTHSQRPPKQAMAILENGLLVDAIRHQSAMFYRCGAHLVALLTQA